MEQKSTRLFVDINSIVWKLHFYDIGDVDDCSFLRTRI